MASTSEYTATVGIPNLRAVFMMRTAISPLLATKSFLKRGASAEGEALVVENVAVGGWEFQEAVVGKRPAFVAARSPRKCSRFRMLRTP